ncbi:hypothetical protein GCM10018785_19360 [Streptomyces longispororuber]|uniref:Dodecin domain-containing protein n=2 Tax=Streptomyces TaxID=1883 RepID=A0A919DI78_9ACTN|nr:hypothetical protein GCM10018785_19360 [Streptomyces longispororuber]
MVRTSHPVKGSRHIGPTRGFSVKSASRASDPVRPGRQEAPARARHYRGGTRTAAERRTSLMSDHTYRVTEIVGTSPEGVDQAIRNGISRASQTLRGLDWFEVTQVRGHIENGEIQHYQVGLKVGFRLEDAG